MAIESRSYRSDADLPRMLELAGQAAADIGPAPNLHLGDVLWRRFMLDEDIVAPEKNIQLWEDAGNLIGFAWFSPPTTLELQTKPGRGPDLIVPMLDWAERRHAESAAETADRELTVDAYPDDHELLAELTNRGFRRDDGMFYNLNARSLDREIGPPALPPGTLVRETTEQEIAARVEIHRDVWRPSRVTESAYRRLRAAPGYRPDLDLVAIAPGGELAAYCICWYDPISRSGEFEPVGTRSAYRGQGYGRAVVTEGLRRLQGLGARSAIVFSSGAEEPANRLYAACGFRPIARTVLYRKAVPLADAAPTTP